MEPKFIREKQLMQLFQVSRTVIQGWRKRGLPYIKLDKVVLYPIEEAREWIVNNVSCNFNELVFKRILIDIMGAGNGESP